TATLSAPSSKTITVDYTTADGTAKAGSDYVAVSAASPGHLTFNPGQTSQTFPIQIIGDIFNEPDETFTVTLTNAVNAGIASGTGTCTILDNDPFPTISINDVTMMERNGGTQDAVFTVTLSQKSKQTVTVDFATQDNTAKANPAPPAQNQDYVP